MIAEQHAVFGTAAPFVCGADVTEIMWISFGGGGRCQYVYMHVQMRRVWHMTLHCR